MPRLSVNSEIAIMPLTPDEIQILFDVVGATQAVEIDCDDCLNQVGEFAETYLLGKPVPEGLKAVEQHLSICNECREEFEALCRAIKELDQQGRDRIPAG
jgi:hypothetical protein